MSHHMTVQKISHQNSTDPLDYPFEADSKSDIHCADNINEKSFDYALFIDKPRQEYFSLTSEKNYKARILYMSVLVHRRITRVGAKKLFVILCFGG